MKDDSKNSKIYDAINLILKHIGEDPEREGLKETAKRMVASWDELLNGYNSNPADIFKLFSHEGYNEKKHNFI